MFILKGFIDSFVHVIPLSCTFLVGVTEGVKKNGAPNPNPCRHLWGNFLYCLSPEQANNIAGPKAPLGLKIVRRFESTPKRSAQYDPG